MPSIDTVPTGDGAPPSSGISAPVVSVVVPCYNDERVDSTVVAHDGSITLP